MTTDRLTTQELTQRRLAMLEILTMSNTLDCGHVPTPNAGIGTGYGVDSNRKRSCYQCCADAERQNMIATGEATLYLVERGTNEGGRTLYKATDWPGLLAFHVYHWRKGRHNIAGERIDAWFRGPDGAEWHGVRYGRNTDILHCKRNKRGS